MKQWFQWLLAIALLSLGISVVAKAGLGATAVTSLAFVTSYAFNISYGVLNMLQNILFIAIQVLLLRKAFPKRQYLQIVMSMLLGVLIDVWGMILPDFTNDTYGWSWLFLVTGCLIIATATYFQLKADKVYNPAEGLVKAISETIQQPFSRVKVIMDTTIVMLAAGLSWLVFKQFIGVREGTLFSALIIGKMVRWIKQLGEKL
ncbi:YitT family protein [Aerococcaceae bacterium DSM 111020]|nr:YitT family protein [Aerococcaceae bacterium DSM 111020]